MLLLRAMRTHWRGGLGVALVIALAGGLSLATLAGARRTASAFTRFLVAADASDLTVGLAPVGDDVTPPDILARTDPILEEAARLPGVERTATYLGLNSMYLAAEGGRVQPDSPEVIGSLDGRYTATDRLTLLRGRLPDPDRPDDVLVNAAAAERYDLALGSTGDLAVIAGELEDVATSEVIASHRFRVVGVGVLPEQVLRDQFDVDGYMFTTPALVRRYLEQAPPYRFQALHLSDDANASTVIEGYERLAGDDFELVVSSTDEQRIGAQLALRPIVVAITVFGVLSALAVLALGGLGAIRAVSAAAGDVGVLRAIGVGRTGILLTVGIPAFAGVAVGAAGAVFVAVALSPLFPIGPVRDVEPRRGVDLDAMAVLGGAGLLFVLLVLVVLTSTAVTARLRRSDQATPPRRPSRLTVAIRVAAVGPAASIGVREGLGVGTAQTRSAIRPTLASTTLSVVAVVATLTFVASIDGLLDSPHRYGWQSDRALIAGAGYISLPSDAAEALRNEPDVRAVAIATYASVRLGDRTVSGMGIDPASGTIAVTVLEGRLPAADDEVAVGVSTARAIGGVGTELDDPAGPTAVVGVVALPAIGQVSHPSMAQGAVLTLDGLSARNAAVLPAVAFLDFVDGADEEAAGARARVRLAGLLQVPVGAVDTYDALRPAELVEVDSAKSTAFGLAAVLAAAAIVALGVTVSASVRQRRSQLAVLAALGFDRRDLRRSVRWQTGSLTGASLLLGVPLGIVAGRTSWTAFADQIGVLPEPVVPFLLVGATIAAIAVAAITVGERPARAASRSRPAAALRSLT
jgi:hypothetical protein